MSEALIDNELSRQVWRSKYQYRGTAETSIEATWARVARALARVEPRDQPTWEKDFTRVLEHFKFLPAGRILAGAGTSYHTTLFNCFVMGFVEDSLEGIFDRLKDAAVTMQWGGGIGCDFSTLRPRGAGAATRGTIASGPVSFMGVWDAMCGTLLSTGARRGAMMGTLRCDHPDIDAFIDAKREPGVLTHFNLSVQVTDAFMQAVANNHDWPLVFPVTEPHEASQTNTLQLRWPGHDREVPCGVARHVPAGELWQRLMDAAYDTAEPGVLFVDRINQLNNLYYREHITSTNPCGEIPLPAFGACDLGSINLTAFVQRPFSDKAALDMDGIVATANTATRLLDNVIDLSEYPLRQQAAEARGSRRIGLGVTGLGDALIMLGHHYDSDSGRALASEALGKIRDTAYRTSIELAREKGTFPYFERDAYLSGEYVGRLPADIRDGIARDGIRNSHLVAIAPTGTISLLANNISSGIEPVFAFEAERRVLNREGEFDRYDATDHAFALWRRDQGRAGALPGYFVTAPELSAEAHLQMQAALQPLVDNSISKTINVPESIGRASFASIYRRAFDLGLKGCTAFRPNPIRGEVLTKLQEIGGVHCCAPDREGD
jgi:ribonucleoside-diphosphate reductase alpha chain